MAKELVTSNDSTRHLETCLNRWNSYKDVAITKLKWIVIHFPDIGTEGGTFDWNYLKEIFNFESSKGKNNNETSDKNNSYKGSDPTTNPNSSDNIDDEENVCSKIKLTCELGDFSEYKSLIISSRQKPKITLEFKNKTTTIGIDSINMLETS